MKVASGELERISLQVGPLGESVKKAFRGMWLIGPDQELTAKPDESGVQWNTSIEYCLAKTAKGRLAVYQFDPDWDTGELYDYDSFEDIRDATMDSGYPAYPENVIAAFANALEIDHEIELDI